MAAREPVEVTGEIGGQEAVAGTLWIHEQRTETATFRYSDSYLASPVSYDLDPALPKSAGIFQSAPGKEPSGSGIPAPATTTPRTGTPYRA
jgi:serine/threonine-protein kinase HipA